MSGSIPAEIGGLTNLTDLYLNYNGLSGSIPAQIGDLTNLTTLFLSINELSGSIPAEIGDLTNLTDLSLHGNRLSGSIPAEIGDLTNLATLWLLGNRLSGSIPAEIGDLTNVTSLWLSGNSLSGSIPAEIGDLTNLATLYLSGNSLSGCVPAVLAAVPRIFFDSYLSYCVPLEVVVSDGRALEGDGVVVFTFKVPASSGGAAGVGSAVSVDYATVAGTAVAGSDYVSASGTLTIPRGSRYATLTVDLVDDAAPEPAESFALELTNPVGATLATATAAATIVDDELLAAEASVAVSVCAGATVTGNVGGAFDVSQRGFARWHDVFVDVGVSCGDGSDSAVGYPTGVAVIGGPSPSVGPSTHCVTLTGAPTQPGTRTTPGARTVTASLRAADGCETFTPAATGGLSREGRSTHVVRLGDARVSRDHQILAWVDADRDGVYGAGEPYDIFASDFASRTLAPSGFYDYDYPRDFQVEILNEEIARVGHAGYPTELNVRLVDPSRDAGPQPLANIPVGAVVFAGPSTGATVTCFSTSSSLSLLQSGQARCTTDDRGEVTFRYLVSTNLDNVFRQEEDSLRVFIDEDRDGQHSHSPDLGALELSRPIYVRIAKALNYVALGDSYSSGENGRRDSTDNPFVGDYRDDNPDPATTDPYCRRWDQAYPQIFANSYQLPRLLGLQGFGFTFDTFACRGAVTANIHNTDDPEGTSTNEEHTVTNRPSWQAPETFPFVDADGNTHLIPFSGWEPRQAVSLAAVQAKLQEQKTNIDIITITIGGNNAGFSRVLKSCLNPFGLAPTCDVGAVADFAELEDDIVTILEQLKVVAPRASIFILGYPYVTPNPCAEPAEQHCGGLALAAMNDPEVYIVVDPEVKKRIEQECDRLSAQGIVGARGWVAGGFASLRSGILRIDYGEALFLWGVATGLNGAIDSAASQVGVHYVDVAGGVVSSDGPDSFVGHSPCDEVPWLNGFVVERKNDNTTSDKSFHPTLAGQLGYARILREFISNAVARGAVLNEAGLPVNPESSTGTGNGARAKNAGSSTAVSGKQGAVGVRRGSRRDSREGDEATRRSGESPADPTGSSWSILVTERVVPPAGECGVFVSPGEQVRLTAGGFAPGATVSFSVRGASAGSAVLGSLALA